MRDEGYRYRLEVIHVALSIENTEVAKVCVLYVLLLRKEQRTSVTFIYSRWRVNCIQLYSSDS